MALDDDVVLNQIQFKDESNNENLTIQLNVIEQLTLLLVMLVVYSCSFLILDLFHLKIRSSNQSSTSRDYN